MCESSFNFDLGVEYVPEYVENYYSENNYLYLCYLIECYKLCRLFP